MSAKVKLHDKSFEINIPATEIQNRILELGRMIDGAYQNKTPVFLIVLNGAFLFAADLLKATTIHCEVNFIRVSSYAGTSTTGAVKNVLGLSQSLKDRDVIIVEDIIDTGHTMVFLLNEIMKHQPASIEIASLLLKPEALQHTIEAKYIGFSVPNDFLVGYGLDYDELGRNLKDIYKLI